MALNIKQLLRPASLKYQLFSWLLILLLPVIFVSALAGYALSKHYINLTYDKALYRSALALADQISVEELGLQVTLPQATKELLEFDEDDDIYFRIVGPTGDLIRTHVDLPLPKTYPKDDEYLYFNTALNQEKLRVVVYSLPALAGFLPSGKNNHIYVLVGETLKKRTLMANEMMLSMLLPQLLIVFLVSALLFFGIKRGLLPLDKLKTELSERSIDDLSPVASTKLPSELQPLLATFNDLLKRVSNTIYKQQRFIGDAAHQLKTPLAGLKTQAELALREKDSTKITHALNQINQASGNLSHLVNQLLSLAKAEPEGTAMVLMKAVDLRQLAQETSGDWVSIALKKNIDLGFEADVTSAVILANAVLLGELMNNLIDNAIRYTPAGGNITVGVKQTFSGFIFYVQDSGIGISLDNQALIFERFYRVLGSQQEGCGLGLTIVKEIALKHQATIVVTSNIVKSDGDSTGTIFEVTFAAT